MKTKNAAAFVILLMAFISCQKANDASQVSLTASTTVATVGETVAVTLNSSANASNWTVSPSIAVAKTYSLTTSKVNYITFNKAGNYTVAVSVKDLAYDS